MTWLVAVADPSTRRSTSRSRSAFVLQAVADPIGLPDGTDDPRVVAQTEARRAARPDRDAPRAHRRDSAVARRRARDGGGVEAARASTTRTIAAAFARVRDRGRGRSTTEVLPATVRADRRRRARRGRARQLPARAVRDGHGALRRAFGANPARIRAVGVHRSRPTSDAVGRTRCARCSSTGSRVRDAGAHPGDAPVLARAGVRARHDRAASSRRVATAPFVEDLLQRTRSGRAARRNASSPRSPRSRTRRRRSRAESCIAPPRRWNPDLRDDGDASSTRCARCRSCSRPPSTTCSRTISNEQALGADVQRRLVPATPAADTRRPRRIRLDRERARRRTARSSATEDPVVVAGEAGAAHHAVDHHHARTRATPARPDQRRRSTRSRNGVTRRREAHHAHVAAGRRSADASRTTSNRRATSRSGCTSTAPSSLFPNGADQIDRR